MELFQASRQWAERPADQRFESLQQLLQVTRDYAKQAGVATGVPYNSLRVEKQGEEIVLVGKENAPARFTHYSFGQLCARIGAPAQYLRDLPATLAAQNLNYGLKDASTPDAESETQARTAQLLFHRNGSLLVRAFTSDKYTRIWNYEVAQRLLPLQEQYGWRVPPARPALDNQPGTRPATEADVLAVKGAHGLSINVGDPIAPAGIYASDHDMFAFLINENNRIKDGTEFGLSRGVFISNSEVGDAALSVTRFLYRSVCGNHIVWDAKNVVKVSVRHVGSAKQRMDGAFRAELVRYANESVSDEEAKIAKAKTFTFGKTKDEVLDTLFGQRNLRVSRKSLTAAYESTEQHPEDGNPTTAWGIANGLTRVSQESSYADKRAELDEAAGRILQVAF